MTSSKLGVSKTGAFALPGLHLEAFQLADPQVCPTAGIGDPTIFSRFSVYSPFNATNKQVLSLKKKETHVLSIKLKPPTNRHPLKKDRPMAPFKREPEGGCSNDRCLFCRSFLFVSSHSSWPTLATNVNDIFAVFKDQSILSKLLSCSRSSLFNGRNKKCRIFATPLDLNQLAHRVSYPRLGQ